MRTRKRRKSFCSMNGHHMMMMKEGKQQSSLLLPQRLKMTTDHNMIRVNTFCESPYTAKINCLLYSCCQCYHYIYHSKDVNQKHKIKSKYRIGFKERSVINFKTIHRNNLLNILITILLLSTWFEVILHTLNLQDKSKILLVDCHMQSRSFQQQTQPTLPLLPNTQLYNPNKANLPDIIAHQGGVIKDKNVTLTKQYNPILVTKDIYIGKGARLTIESGTELLFEKKRGIFVHGILEILGNSNDKVKLNLMKSQQSATVNFRSQNNNPIGQQQVRLVDGELPNEGRVQIKFNDKWHSLCTGSKNLTAADIRVLCQQVGYQEGSWYKWFPRRNETTSQIMSKSFHCSGTEKAISQCKRWNRVRAGGGVCNYHSDIGIRCSKTLIFGTVGAPSYEYWRGIEFINSETSYEYVLDGQMKQKVSRSIIRQVSINQAGLNEVGNATAAIRVYGQPPRMNELEIKNSVYGIMIEDVDEAFQLDNIRVLNNMANPIFVNTSWGKVSLNNLHVENNGGDGIRVARHEKILIGSHDFCKFANLGSSQSYPVVLSHEQTFFTSGRDCCQEFTSSNQLTVHFPVLRSTPNNLLPEGDANRRITIPPGVDIGKDANLVIYDDYRDEFPFRLTIRNNTRAQSIVSKSGRLRICYEPASYRTVLFTIEIVADIDDEWTGIGRDVEISHSFISNNDGRGIWIENPRSGVKILNTTVMNHDYLSGVHIENGTGEVIIQGSKISNNIGHGLFIDLAGGYYHIDNSTISDNSQKGISINYDKRPELVSFNHTVHVGYSLVARNGENGLFIGNVCRSDAFWNISMNSFIKNGEDAIFYQSCLPTQDSILSFRNLTSRHNSSDPDKSFQELLITHNIFLSNIRRAICMAPVFFIKSFIRHNMFKDHQSAVLYIGNQALLDPELDNLTQAPVNIRVVSNCFYSNYGRYVVNIGVHEDNPKHSLMFTKNYLENNVISEPYTDLKPRSRVSAVVVVSSSNTKVIRNRFNNPLSAYELGSHLEIHSKVINATANFWGHGLDATSIYKRIFDRKNRYNLAQVEFLQYLLSPEDLEYATDLSFDRERDKITVFRNGTKLGGEVKGYEELDIDTYVVQDDIYVRPGAFLILKPGTVLKFQDGVGMMVQGRLDAIGQASSHIVFTSAISTNRIPQRTPLTTTPSPLANPWVSHQPEGGGTEEETGLVNVRGGAKFSSYKTDQKSIIKREIGGSIGAQNVRLSHTTMGRLEVQIDGTWGSVCDYNFDINDAAVACQQLGMILNKDDWLLEKFQYAANDQQQISIMSNNVLMTNLRCDPTLDIDITKCKSEISSRGDFDGMCDSEVGIRCFPPSWSGVRFGMGAEVSTMEYVTIQRAGMYDYAAYALKPALQVDFYRHLFSSLVVKSNSDSGFGVMWSDVIGRHFSELSITDSKFLNNERHGIELRSKGLSIKSCSIGSNRQNGLDYDPTLSLQEMDDLISWLHTPKNTDNIVKLSFPLQNKYFSVPSSEDSYKFFIFQKNPLPDLKETFTIGTDPGHMLSIHLLYPIHPDSTENLNMSIGLNLESPIWNFNSNLTSFPMVSPGYKFHFNYSTGDRPFGNVVLYIRSHYNNRDLKLLTRYTPPHLVTHKFEKTAENINAKLLNSLVITNSNITRNRIGLMFRHSNYFHSSRANYNRRYSNETTNITNNVFDGNHFSSIFVGSEEFETYNWNGFNKTISNSEVTYYVSGNKFRRNKDGIRQFSRDIRSSNNVYHWSIINNTMEFNRGGGVNILLPYFWGYDANLSHSIATHNNSFFKNSQFEFSVEGHFVDLNISGNIFKENRCKNRLIGLGGMEKKMIIKHNIIEYNACNRIVEFDIQSHADKLGFIPAIFEFNSLRYNKKLVTNSSYLASMSNSKYPKLLNRLHPHATDYALSLEGVQVLNLTRNLFINPDLRFELVVAVIMDPEETTIKATENYWGSILLADISDRIFDFDDWNNYAVAELSPLLTTDSFSAATMLVESRNIHQLPTRPLGGRLRTSLTLVYRKEPYLIESDLTVLPNVRLTIEKGVTLEFMPNVGILVLGELIAAGTRERPIQMRPSLSSSDIMPLHQYIFPLKAKPFTLHSILNDPLSYEHSYTFRHYQSAYPVDMGSIRLCKNEICNDGSHIYENNIEDPTLRQEVLMSYNNTWKMDGFLEIFNMTTLQWVPVCDPLFTEYTAKVICRQLGYSHLSLFKRGRRYTIEQEQITSIRHWPESVQCEGDETNLSNCPLGAIGSFNHTSACTRESNQFVYVYCQDFSEESRIGVVTSNHGLTNENVNNWGGIRFSCPSVSVNEGRDSYNMINENINKFKSRLHYVNIDKAGMLHRKKAASVQVYNCNVQIEYLSINNSAHHGLEIITSQGHQNFHQLKVQNSLGVGLNYLSLTGSSSASRLVPYLPLKHLDTSSEVFGFVDICGGNKEIQVEERLLLFYKYTSRAVDCVKLISSKLPIKHIGIRMLQFNLFNSTSYTPKPDSIRIYDGNIFDRDSRLLVELGVTERHRIERPELKFYQTTDNTMTVRMHVSEASSIYGFIAEIVTTPVSYNIQRDTYNNITFSEFTNNKLGAMSLYSAGESSPNIIVKNNRFELNCMHLFGNFTSCVNPIYMELQNCQRLKIINNFVKSNQGGIMIKSHSHSAVSALDASIEYNVFENNNNTSTLAILGPKTDPYQSVKVIKNFFTRNYAPFSSNVILSRIVANFSYNIITANTGKHQIEVIGFDKLPLSFQTFMRNWVYNNIATLERDRSTIFGNSAGQQYSENYLVNPDNNFELSTLNWSRYDVKPFHTPRDDEIIHLSSGDGSSKDVIRKTADAIPLNIIDTKRNDLYHATINAEHNWWGFDTKPAIQGRIRDRIQHEELVKVDFVPFLETNHTVLSGICAGGWQKVGEACLVYVGARMNYQEARDFCDRERATLPLLRGNHEEFSDFIKSQEIDFDPRVHKIWIRSFEVSRDACPALNDYRTKNYDCQDRYPFLCEKDPQIVVTLLHWHRETGGLVALVLALVTILLTLCCTICWGFKSRHRRKEKIERKNSIYASMRSNRGPYSSNNSLSELFLHRQIYNPEKQSITNLSSTTQITQNSVENGSNQVRLDPSYNPAAQIKSRNRVDLAQTFPNDIGSRSQFESQPSTNPAYIKLAPPKETVKKSPTLSVNPDYTIDDPSMKRLNNPSAHNFSLEYLRPSSQEQPYKLTAPSFNSRKAEFSSQEQFIKPPTPTHYPGYARPPMREQHKLSSQSLVPSYDPDYNSSQKHFNKIPSPPSIQPVFDRMQSINEQYSKPINPAPAYREAHPKALSNGSRTPSSHASSYNEEAILTDPMPMPAPTYTQIRHNTVLGANDRFPSPPVYNFDQVSYDPEPNDAIDYPNNNQMRDIDESESSVPTYYSNQYEESSHSFKEEYNNAYNNALQKFNDNDSSFILTEHSSITDLLINSTKLIRTTSVIDNQTEDLVGTIPQEAPLNYAADNEFHGPSNNRTLSETVSGPQNNRYFLETSFDFDEPPTVALNSMFGSSQRLSPVSSSYTQSDSKHGSRVYLETSFE